MITSNLNSQNQTFELPTLTQLQLLGLLKKRPLEDIDLISQIESFFKSKRGYVYKQPRKKTPVILLFSGGLDTTIILDILMRKYNLEVYPIFFRRGQIRMGSEEKSVDYFSKYYLEKYPSLFHRPKKLTTLMPPLEIRWNITKFGNYPILKKPTTNLGLPLYSSLLVDYAVQYAYFLEMNHTIKIRDIFCGFMESDGRLYKYETLTALRTNMYNICNLTNDYSWQFTSLALEKELGFLFDKEILIQWAKAHDLPIDKTHSCIKFSYFQCGNCDFCKIRQQAFKKAAFNDQTVYLRQLRPLFLYQIINKIMLAYETIFFLFRIWFEFMKNFIYFFKHRY